jgi:hypothetical protein
VSKRDDSGQSPFVTFIVLVGALVFLAGLGYVLYLGARDAPGVIAALVTALGAVLAVVAGRIYETRTAVEQARRERMASIYERLIENFYNGASGDDRAPTAEELQAFFEELAQRLLIWGPTPVIVAFITWKRDITNLPEGSPETLLAFERLIVAMRKDLGTKSAGLDPGDLLRVFIDDLDQHLAATK